MRIFLSLALFLLMFVGCSSNPAKQPASSEQASGVKLNLSPSPRQGFAPLHVTLQANLEGASANDQKYYCLQEEWDFGDGAKSTEKPNCDPFNADSKIKTEFFVDHMYEREGNYTVRLVLGQENEDQVRSRQVSVVVLEKSLGPN